LDFVQHPPCTVQLRLSERLLGRSVFPESLPGILETRRLLRRLRAPPQQTQRNDRQARDKRQGPPPPVASEDTEGTQAPGDAPAGGLHRCPALAHEEQEQDDGDQREHHGDQEGTHEKGRVGAGDIGRLRRSEFRGDLFGHCLPLSVSFSCALPDGSNYIIHHSYAFVNMWENFQIKKRQVRVGITWRRLTL
jgi:hypothetical protein